ncbi:MAG: phospho-N-acetylmuramoyl-pentapeptide-transferase [Candidatus Omnitrophica bacterium]|nr:phospho-N-acetylmuramoyl-pentapeptide-transferase [Candidatus Omnitrophota bacterium]
MLYHLLYPLKEIFFGFNVFRYLTFRAAGASITAFLLSVLIGPLIYRKIKALRVSEDAVREHAPSLTKLHRSKKGTPTMGGLAILFSLLGSTLLWANLSNPYILLLLTVSIWLGLVGLLDDTLKFVMRSSRGLAASTKFLGQIIAGTGIALFLYFAPDWNKILTVPFLKNFNLELGLLYIPFVILVIVGSSNAVNLTDGLDGLAVGCVIMVAISYSILAYLTGHVKFSEYLKIPYVAGSGELAIFCSALVGAGLGFLWYNCHPAEVFMGDTGSLSLGGVIGTVAVLIHKELVLFIAGGIFVAEAFSVILQILSFKLTGKRIFLMSPLHHHFELKGWDETKVTIRFWIVGAILVFLSLSTLKLR